MADISYGIIGLNTFGKELAINLAQSSKDIMVIDTDEEAVRDLREYTENAFVVRSYDNGLSPNRFLRHWKGKSLSEKEDWQTLSWIFA